MHLQSISHYINSAESALEKGDMARAELLLQKAKAELEKLGSKHKAWLPYYVNLSAVYNNTGRFTECIEACDKAKQLLPFRGENYLKGHIAASEATAWLNTGNYNETISHTGNAISFYQKAGAQKKEGKALIKRGVVFFRTGRWDEAIDDFSKAMQVSKEANDSKLEIEALLETGRVFRQQKWFYLAMDHFREAEWKSCAKSYSLNQAEALYEMASTYLALERQEDAQACIEAVETLTPEDSVMRSFLLRLHYKIALCKKDYLSALNYARQIRDFFETVGDKKGIAESLVLTGNAHCHLSQSEDAKQYADAALEKAKQICDQEIIAAASSLLKTLSAPPADDSSKASEPAYEKNHCVAKKVPGILDILDDIAREEEDVRSYPVLGSVWSDFGGEDKFKISEERSGGPYVLRPTTPAPLTFYRGQIKFYKNCLPIIYRNNEQDNVDLFIERLRSAEFELLLRNHPFVKEVFDKGVAINYQGKQVVVPLKVSYLGLAQHYGLKTDMMDFTSDKWVAAFFATNRSTPQGYKPVHDEELGVVYRYSPSPESPEKNSDPAYKPRLETVGLQPFSRPGEQRAFALKLDEGENMNDIPNMQRGFFKHNQKAAKVIHSRMNQGNSLFPPDDIIQLANKIKETHKISSKAFELTWKRYPLPNSDKDNAMQACKQKNIKICNYPVFRLSKDIDKRFRTFWQNTGKDRFYGKIVSDQ